MKVNVEIASEYKDPYAVIYTDTMSDEISRAVEILREGAPAPITAVKDDETMVLKPQDVFLVRIENEKTVVYTEKEKCISKRRLYEISEQLGSGFMQISKSTLVNLSCLDRIESDFGGAIIVKLKNGLCDYVSRKYLPGFKKYLGM